MHIEDEISLSKSKDDLYDTDKSVETYTC